MHRTQARPSWSITIRRMSRLLVSPGQAGEQRHRCSRRGKEGSLERDSQCQRAAALAASLSAFSLIPQLHS